jgi:hypothetical protein
MGHATWGGTSGTCGLEIKEVAMSGSTRRRVGLCVILGVGSLAVAGPLQAQATAPFDLDLPAGQACAFRLGVNVMASDHRVVKEFTDPNGDVVRTIQAGKGSTLTFTNVATGAAVTLKGNGAVSKETFNPDGSSTVVSTGHNVIILFPTDNPAGPTTTLYTGRVVYTSTVTKDFTIISVSGRTRDICAELSA